MTDGQSERINLLFTVIIIVKLPKHKCKSQAQTQAVYNYSKISYRFRRYQIKLCGIIWKNNENMGILPYKNKYDKQFELFEIFYDNRWHKVAILFFLGGSYSLLLVEIYTKILS